MRIRKRLTTLFLLLAMVLSLLPVTVFAEEDVVIDDANFPDPAFRSKVAEFDVDKDGSLSAGERNSVTWLDLRSMKIESVDHLDLFPNLLSLNVSHNSIARLDLTGLDKLQYLNCSYNQLPALDVSVCSSLQELVCDNNFFEITYRSYHMTNFPYFDFDKASDWQGGFRSGDQVFLNSDSNAMTYMYDCGRGFSAVLGLKTANPNPYTLAINAANFPDAAFRNYIQRFDTNNDHYLTQKERDAATTMYLTDLGISDLTGIGHFQSLLTLYCSENNLASLDVSQCTRLQVLYCYSNQLMQLNISGCSDLRELVCYENKLPVLDTSGCPMLQSLSCDYNQLTSLDLGANRKIKTVSCMVNRLSGISVYGCTDLESLACDYNQLTELPLEGFQCLKYLSCSNNQLSCLSLYDAPLTTLNTDDNRRHITLTGNTFALSNLPGFHPAYAGNWQGASEKNGILTVTAPVVTYTYTCRDGFDQTFTLLTDYEDMSQELLINAENFPDTQLRYCVSEMADTNSNGRLSPAEIAAVTLLDLSDKGIADLTGLEYFTALEQLSVGSNGLTTLNLAPMKSITSLDCSGNQLTAFDTRLFPNLELLDISENQLTTLDLTQATRLIGVECSDNRLVEVKANSALQGLSCSGNRLTSLDLSVCPRFVGLICNKNSYDLPGRTFDLRQLPGFDATKAGNWQGGTVSGTTLTVNSGSEKVTYTYDCGRNCTATFTLIPGEAAALQGDVDGNGAVNILDVMAIINIITGSLNPSASQRQAADLNTDGNVNIFDTMSLISIITS